MVHVQVDVTDTFITLYAVDRPNLTLLGALVISPDDKQVAVRHLDCDGWDRVMTCSAGHEHLGIIALANEFGQCPSVRAAILDQCARCMFLSIRTRACIIRAELGSSFDDPKTDEEIIDEYLGIDTL
ncbi:hypothetical protein [Providencia phage Kokobel2]|nr:hypothetical protein [Providencia phage Kokobel2]